jgi:hypothetical protein
MMNRDAWVSLIKVEKFQEPSSTAASLENFRHLK